MRLAIEMFVITALILGGVFLMLNTYGLFAIAGLLAISLGLFLIAKNITEWWF